jgi:putative tryptophan/tyrosine transport system substrate-binding protein
MNRREFIAGLGGAVIWPPVARGQSIDSVKRIVWMGTLAEDAVTFGRELARLGWIEGRDVSVDYRIELDDRRMHALAPSIVGARPDVIVTVGTSTTELFKQLTNTIPIVFNNVPDPVANGLVASFAHPSGNVTGISNHQFSFAGKWLSILKELDPSINNVVMLYEPANSNWQGFLPILETAALSLGVKVHPAPATVTANVFERIENFARDFGGGMIVLPTLLTVGERSTIAALAARHRLPAIYPFKFFVTSGGLVSYGVDIEDQTRQTAQYTDRILRGVKPADLPVHAPVNLRLVINVRAAAALGLPVPPTLLALADEVIE